MTQSCKAQCISLEDKPRLEQDVYFVPPDGMTCYRCRIKRIWPQLKRMQVSHPERIPLSSYVSVNRCDRWYFDVNFDEVYLNYDEAAKRVFVNQLKAKR